jgi:hypothetical protein
MTTMNITEQLQPLYALMDEIPTIVAKFYPIIIPLAILGAYVTIVHNVPMIVDMIPKYLKIKK